MSVETKAIADGGTEPTISDLLYTFEQFKTANDERLAEVEKRGSADALLTEKVSQIEAGNQLLLGFVFMTNNADNLINVEIGNQ